jgi:anti-sigma B factor antagonist
MDFLLDRSTGEKIGIAVMPERLDMVNSRQLKSLYQQWMTLAERMVFDCSQLRFIDSSGLGAIVSCLRMSILLEGDLRLSGLVPRVAMVFELTRADQLFSMYPDLKEALESFSQKESNEPSVP